MKILVQWTKLDPEDWMELDLAQGRRGWRELAKKAEPTGDEQLDNSEGWIFDVCIQGVHIYGFDHYGAEPITAQGNRVVGVRIFAWNDDPEDWPEGTRFAQVWEFRMGWADRSHRGVRHRGPDQSLTVYAEEQSPWWGRDLSCGGQSVPILPWSEFSPPNHQVTRHGIWVHDEETWQRHFAARRRTSWREWVEE